MTSVPKNVAFNPIPWAVTSKGFDFESMPPIDYILGEIKSAGFASVHAEIPGGYDEESYIKILQSSGLFPAPGYFQASFGDRNGRKKIIDDARRTAGFHSRLGLDRIFIAEQYGVEPLRIVKPGVGENYDASRLSRIAEGLNEVAEIMAAEGVFACLHPHVGTLIETELEIEFVLGATSEKLLFGPDTGHLKWAGVDPGTMLRRHRDRIGAVHIKDLHAAVAESAQSAKSDYTKTMLSHLWTEPGRGDVDFGDVFSALGGFDGWFVIEVDYSDQPTVEECVRTSARWAASNAEKFCGN